MATIDTLLIVTTVLENNGVYVEEDGQVYSVVRYKNPWGKTSIAFTYSKAEENRYFQSKDISEVAHLWTRTSKLTTEGRLFMDKVKHEEIKSLPF